MRERMAVFVAVLVVGAMTGCANLQSREWSTCAVSGAIIGGAVGGITGGVAVNNADDDPSNGERGAGIGGGLLAGAALGALLGHAICDPVKEAPPPAAAAPPPPPPAPGTKLGTVGSAYFDFDRAELKAHAGKDDLSGVVKTMKDTPSVNVSVEGHTDSLGSDAYNQELSERRAGAVKTYLVGQGIDAGRITTRGFGESRPVASNDTEAGRAQNRRAEIIAR